VGRPVGLGDGQRGDLVARGAPLDGLEEVLHGRPTYWPVNGGPKTDFWEFTGGR
jgi:hypothetical protein